jgi:hypothetical protein
MACDLFIVGVGRIPQLTPSLQTKYEGSPASAPHRRPSSAIHWHFLTYSPREPQTYFMPHIYIQFDFAKDEDKVQQARHKLEGWKQAYRLDKKLLFKFERIPAAAPAEESAKPNKSEKPDKSKGKSKAKPEAPVAAAPSESVKLLVRLDFSNHEKLSGQRWLQRIPSEEPFQGASPLIVKPTDAPFADTEKHFDDLV